MEDRDKYERLLKTLDEIAAENEIDTVSQLPVTPKLAGAVDAGLIELFEGNWLDELANKIENL